MTARFRRAAAWLVLLVLAGTYLTAAIIAHDDTINLIAMLVLVMLVRAAYVGGLFSRSLGAHREGCCPRCAYDLRHRPDDGCPECGWNRTPELTG